MRTRYIALLSLAIMGIGFIITLFLPDDEWWVQLLNGGFEAGLVGGFADWFAVTALFRHPMGLPIPHTSLLLKNRNKIANALISALENELLNKESITRKLKQFQLIALAGSSVVRLLAIRSNRIAVAGFGQTFLAKLPLERIVPYLQHGLATSIRHVDSKPLVQKTLDYARNERIDEKVFDYALNQGRSWVSKPETRLLLGSIAQQKITETKVGGLMGFAVQAFAGYMTEDKLGTMIQQLILSALQDLVQPSSPSRERLLGEIHNQLQEFAGDEEALNRGKYWLAEVVESQGTGTMLLEQLEAMRARLNATLEKEKDNGGRSVLIASRYVIRKLQGEQELLEGMELRFLDFIVRTVEANHYRIGLLLKDNIDRMNDRELVKMLEQKVGDDLQWIRVNGAICGFAIGLILTVIHWA
jgi:uncharacterized membrane-anchored protein YjiN (DUF445 family)